jgi:hypothetical protein
MVMVAASYVGALWGQEENGELVWRKTRVFLATPVEEAPTRALKDEWIGLLPHAPAARGVHLPWFESLEERSVRRKAPNEEEGLRNARALENRLRRAGWLGAEVQASWSQKRGSSELHLLMFPGHRWYLDSVIWVAAGSGLPQRRLEEVARILPGDPFELSRLQNAQDRIASYARSLGHSTFHSGHIQLDADTLNRSASHAVVLTVTCLPWDPSTAGWSTAAGVATGTTLPHPKVRIGDVTWNGQKPGEVARPGGLREEVWQHLVRVQPGQVYKPQNLSNTYADLSRLRAVNQVDLSEAMRWDSTANEVEVGLPGRALMDVDFAVTPRPSHDLGLGLDMVRNDARYGPKVSTTLHHRNPRGWGAENAWEVAFGYVAVSPFSSLNRQTILNSGEWTVRWKTSQLGIAPLKLDRFEPSASPFTSMDVGWDREVWPEFTRSQFHIQHDVGFTENPERGSTVRWSPINVSFVNLSNRDSTFVSWLENQNNPLIQARFNNHLTLGSSASWESGWARKKASGRLQIQASWAGMMAQKIAEAVVPADQLDTETGAWLVAENVPLVQHQRIMTSWSARRESRRDIRSVWAGHILLGWANAGANTPSLPLEQAFFTGGANGVRGWRLRTLGPGNVSASDSSVAILGVGDVRLDVQMEWRRALNETWSMAAFTDAGNVWLHGDEAPDLAAFQWGKWESLAWSLGAGVRYDLEFFLLRLDGALRLHDPAAAPSARWIGSNGLKGALHLGLGVPF